MAKIKDRSRDRKYFTMIPNMLWTMGLSVYDLWLYATLKKICGEDGECYYSSRQLSNISGVSVGMISRCKESLVRTGLIAIEDRPSPDGPARDEITICDVWKRNQLSCSQDDQPDASCSPHDQPCSQGDQPCSQGDQSIIRKNKNHRRRTKEEEQRLSNACENIYLAYPRKVGKQDAIRAIEKTVAGLVESKRFESEDGAAEWLHGRVAKFAQSPAGQAGEYTPHPATWFNKGRFDDDDAEWSRRNGKHGDKPPADDPRGNRAAMQEYLRIYGDNPIEPTA